MPKNDSWKRNFPNARPKQDDAKLTETVNIVQPQVSKSGKTCGNPNCCMRAGGRSQITYGGPTLLDGNGNDRGGYTFKGIEPPMLCGGTAWQPKQLSKWEKQRREAASAPGLSDFKKKPNGSNSK